MKQTALVGITESQIKKYALRSGKWANISLPGCAYVFRDGVVFKHDESLKPTHGGIEVWKLVEGRVKLPSDVQRVVVSDTLLLVHGIYAIEVYRNNSSMLSKQQGITNITTVTLYTPAGGRFRWHEFGFITGNVTLQPDSFVTDPGDSAAEMIESLRKEGRIVAD